MTPCNATPLLFQNLGPRAVVVSFVRLWLFKIGALVRVTVRKVWVSLSSACPYRDVVIQAYEQLSRVPSAAGPPGGC